MTEMPGRGSEHGEMDHVLRRRRRRAIRGLADLGPDRPGVRLRHPELAARHRALLVLHPQGPSDLGRARLPGGRHRVRLHPGCARAPEDAAAPQGREGGAARGPVAEMPNPVGCGLMRAVTIVDGDLQYLEHPDPVPGDTELVVAVHAAGINNADLMQRVGFYPAPPGSPPDIPGMELAGEVVATGRRTTRFVGRRSRHGRGGRRCAGRARRRGRTRRHGGADASELARGRRIPRGVLHRLRRARSPSAACRIGRAGARHRAPRAGSGTRGCSWPPPRERGAWPRSVTRQLRDAVATLGAVAVDPDEALGLGPFDVVLELVGAASLPGVLGAMAVTGRIAVIGVGGGVTGRDRPAHASCSAGSASVDRRCGPGRRSRRPSWPGAVERHVVPLLEARRVRVLMEATFPMDQAGDGLRAVRPGREAGQDRSRPAAAVVRRHRRHASPARAGFGVRPGSDPGRPRHVGAARSRRGRRRRVGRPPRRGLRRPRPLRRAPDSPPRRWRGWRARRVGRSSRCRRPGAGPWEGARRGPRRG